eukprot:CAMPEP_0168736134 /NCGR_PEP_ID=MMETSP0724-20121128/9706_1 /TAXON_ID=265536 /ORGANISM="Amphiprora sp., Strain CCMP467" /LENGTH=295 /DNA_ID=CAMNT_0008783327 /DNA_START=159 /DNA_END=1046 /DNA_ORIENTATION=-
MKPRPKSNHEGADSTILSFLGGRQLESDENSIRTTTTMTNHRHHQHQHHHEHRQWDTETPSFLAPLLIIFLALLAVGIVLYVRFLFVAPRRQQQQQRRRRDQERGRVVQQARRNDASRRSMEVGLAQYRALEVLQDKLETKPDFASLLASTTMQVQREDFVMEVDDDIDEEEAAVVAMRRTRVKHDSDTDITIDSNGGSSSGRSSQDVDDQEEAPRRLQLPVTATQQQHHQNSSQSRIVAAWCAICLSVYQEGATQQQRMTILPVPTPFIGGASNIMPKASFSSRSSVQEENQRQ